MVSFPSLHHFFRRIYSQSFIPVLLAATTITESLNATQTFFVDDNRETRPGSLTSPPSAIHAVESPQALYDGGYSDASIRGVALRIANGGAGQAGLIKEWADAFIQYSVERGAQPFQVAWYLGDTTDSLAMVSSGIVDVAVTYNPAAEKILVDTGDVVQRVYGFRDHFSLVGPRSNPARLHDTDDIYKMFSKIVASGNADVKTPPEPSIRSPTRFLSRFDKSATNIKESQIFVAIGQVPWALTYSRWYHQYAQFPFEALRAAALLSEYTLIDMGSWISADDSVTKNMRMFKTATDGADDVLLNPAHVLLGKQGAGRDVDGIVRMFMNWVTLEDGGQHVVATFARNGRVLFSRAPRTAHEG